MVSIRTGVLPPTLAAVVVDGGRYRQTRDENMIRMLIIFCYEKRNFVKPNAAFSTLPGPKDRAYTY